jgi:hypothetical protein
MVKLTEKMSYVKQVILFFFSDRRCRREATLQLAEVAGGAVLGRRKVESSRRGCPNKVMVTVPLMY